MIPRLTTTRDAEDERWGCHSCGARYGLLVIRSEHDEDGYPIRIRRCTNCKAVFATEEKPFPLEQFYGRANTHKERNAKIAREKWHVCTRCEAVYGVPSRDTPNMFARAHATYRYGTYSEHVNRPWHLATLRTKPTPHSREIERERRRRDYWRARGIDIDTADASHALREDLAGPKPCRFCNEIHTLSCPSRRTKDIPA